MRNPVRLISMEQKSTGLRIAHLSDPHFSKISYDLKQFLSKRWIGNLNLYLFRKRSYYTEHLAHLPELIESLKVDSVFITGDFSSTSSKEEFIEGEKFVNAFKERGLPTFILPGNHDCYTRSAERKRSFYNVFSLQSLQDTKVESLPLKNGWWYIGLDCALATPPFCSYGYFSEEMEEHLRSTLSSIPKEQNILICNHFPLFTSRRPNHELSRAKALQALLRSFPQVKLYLHGHDHHPYIIDRQYDGYPLVLNSGSCAHKPEGMFYLIDLFEKECLVQHLLFRRENQNFFWVIDWQKHYNFKH